MAFVVYHLNSMLASINAVVWSPDYVRPVCANGSIALRMKAQRRTQIQ